VKLLIEMLTDQELNYKTLKAKFWERLLGIFFVTWPTA